MAKKKILSVDDSASVRQMVTFALENAGYEVVTAVDNSCLMHIGGGLSRRQAPVRYLHLAEILAAQEAGQ